VLEKLLDKFDLKDWRMANENERERERTQKGILKGLDQTGRKRRKFEFGYRDQFLASFWSPVET
jgi:hypothetical protein